MIEKPTEWCLFWLGPCLPSSEWASWAQAVFSALAVLAAIGLVWWQQYLSKRDRAAAARLVASGLLTLIGQTIGGIQSVATGLQERISGQENLVSTLQNLAATLGALPLPSKEDLLALNAELPKCSVKLLRASNAAKQLQTALEHIAAIPTPNVTSSLLQELCKPLLELALDATKNFNEAKQELDNFCPP